MASGLTPILLLPITWCNPPSNGPTIPEFGRRQQSLLGSEKLGQSPAGYGLWIGEKCYTPWGRAF